ncbi:Down syndrome cell adhesion molecule-like protein, partial [Operophtera brumata]
LVEDIDVTRVGKSTLLTIPRVDRLLDGAPLGEHATTHRYLHPGPTLALHCAASGSPAPSFTWLLDGAPLEEDATTHY